MNKVEATDYAMREYGATGEALAGFAKKVHGKIEKERKAGKLQEFTGNLEALVTGRKSNSVSDLY